MTAPALTGVYTDLAAEYWAFTEGAGLHDSSYTGRLKATGEDALDLLNRLSTNGIVNLAPGQAAPTILTTDRGRILDLLSVVNTGDYTLLVTSPGCQQTVIDWLDKYTIMEDLEVEDISGGDGPVYRRGSRGRGGPGLGGAGGNGVRRAGYDGALCRGERGDCGA